MAIHRGRVDLLQQQLDANPELVHQRFEMPNDNTYCPLNGGTLLHLVAEYNEYPNALVNAKQLLARGADINARTTKSVDGTDGHTPIFHLLRIWIQTSEKLLNFLIEQGADLTVKGTFMVNGEQLELTPLGFELRRQPNPPYSGGPSQRVIEMLRANGVAE